MDDFRRAVWCFADLTESAVAVPEQVCKAKLTCDTYEGVARRDSGCFDSPVQPLAGNMSLRECPAAYRLAMTCRAGCQFTAKHQRRLTMLPSTAD